VRDEGTIRSAALAQPSGGMDDLLVEFAGKLEPDGGMPGATEEIRATNSLAALLFFVEQGNTPDAGPFRLHVERLLRFLEAQRLQALGTDKAELASLAVGLAAAGRVPKGNWLWHARKLAANREVVRSIFWRDLAKAVGA